VLLLSHDLFRVVTSSYLKKLKSAPHAGGGGSGSGGGGGGGGGGMTSDERAANGLMLQARGEDGRSAKDLIGAGAMTADELAAIAEVRGRPHTPRLPATRARARARSPPPLRPRLTPCPRARPPGARRTCVPVPSPRAPLSSLARSPAHSLARPPARPLRGRRCLALTSWSSTRRTS
jgi:hypothetical protein